MGWHAPVAPAPAVLTPVHFSTEAIYILLLNLKLRPIQPHATTRIKFFACKTCNHIHRCKFQEKKNYITIASSVTY